MQYLVGDIISSFKFSRSFVLFCALICLICIPISAVLAQSKTPASPENDIAVKNYKWGSSSAGGAGIIKEITLENNGKIAYKDIELKVELYSVNEVPLGSLRSIIHEVLPGGSEKTFYNVNFGFMHSDAQRTEVSVVGGEAVDTLGHPRDLIVVKNWDWTGGQYSTEGILKDITLENKSETNYKNIEVQVYFFSNSGSKLGPSRAVIHDILPARSEKTFHGINVGFRDPGANKTTINVLNAERAPVKKGKPTVAKKSGVIEKYRKKSKAGDKTTRGGTGEQPQIPHLSEKSGTAKTPQTKVALGITKGTPQTSGITETSGEGNLQEKKIGAPPSREGETPGEGYEEEPVPRDDIVVKDFKWGGSVTGTFGTFREITLENKSGITYKNIELIVELYGSGDRRPLGSYNVTIKDVLPPNSEKVFRNVKVGYLSVIPQDIQVRIDDASVLR